MASVGYKLQNVTLHHNVRLTWARPARKADNPHCLENVRASKSHNLTGLHDLLQGVLYVLITGGEFRNNGYIFVLMEMQS
jgi:hypothetical protein